MRKFDSKKCINNIYYLIKDRNMKIGDVEKEVGVSTGYFSRLSKDDNQGSPSTETLCALSELLSVSLDSLVYLDLSEMGPQDKLVSDFILKLIDKTTSGSLLWNRGDNNSVFVDIKNFDQHPLYDENEYSEIGPTGYPEPIFKHEYNTIFRKGGDIVGEFYDVEIEENARLYIVKTGIPNPSPFDDTVLYENLSYELFMYADNELEGICHTDSLLGKFYEKILPQLYDAAAVSSRKSKINGKVKKIINKFMKDND